MVSSVIKVIKFLSEILIRFRSFCAIPPTPPPPKKCAESNDIVVIIVGYLDRLENGSYGTYPKIGILVGFMILLSSFDEVI